MPLYTPRRRRKPDINIVPLVDVLVVLIFFFILTMQAKDTKSLDITPPKMDTAGPAKPSNQRVIISVDKAGEYFIANKQIAPDQLPGALQDIAKTQGQDANILIFADQETPLKNVTYVMDEGRKLNLDKIRLQVR